MAAHEAINPMQLQLFLDPEEHIASVTHSVDAFTTGGSMSAMWERKEQESRVPKNAGGGWMHGAGVYSWMKRKVPMRDPVAVMIGPEGHLEQEEGHHRLAAGAALQREAKARARKKGQPEVQTQFIPVKYEQRRYLSSHTGRTAGGGFYTT